MKNMLALIRCSIFLLIASGSIARADQLLDTPVYDPSSKSYFALIDGRQHQAHYHTGYVWQEALEDAPTRVFRGVKGRLAIVSSFDTHEFLLKTFRLAAPAWIGFHYECVNRTVVDSAGHVLARTSFSAWDQVWNQDPKAVCVINPFTHQYDPGDYASVAYSPISEGFHWIAKGVHKGYDFYFIEWPTGAP